MLYMAHMSWPGNTCTLQKRSKQATAIYIACAAGLCPQNTTQQCWMILCACLTLICVQVMCCAWKQSCIVLDWDNTYMPHAERQPALQCSMRMLWSAASRFMAGAAHRSHHQCRIRIIALAHVQQAWQVGSGKRAKVLVEDTVLATAKSQHHCVGW